MKWIPRVIDSALWTAAATWFAVETAGRMIRFYVEELREGTAGPCETCGCPEERSPWRKSPNRSGWWLVREKTGGSPGLVLVGASLHGWVIVGSDRMVNNPAFDGWLWMQVPELPQATQGAR